MCQKKAKTSYILKRREYIATTPTIQEFETNKMLGNSKNMPKIKEMKTTANRRSDKDLQLLRPTTFLTMLEALRSA
jgi:hypothetical protein